MMTVTPVTSSSSSTTTAVSTGSPENTWLGHWASIRLRMVSRRTAGVKVEEYRLDPEDKDIRTSHHTPPQAAHTRKGHHISKAPQVTNIHSYPSWKFQNTTKEKSHCSPSRKAHAYTIWPDFWVGMVLVGNHRLFRIFEFPASETVSERFSSTVGFISISSSVFSLLKF